MEKQLEMYFAILRNFSRIFLQGIIDNGKSIKADLKLSQIKAIAAFHDKDCFSMKELANNIGVKQSNMTMMVHNLIKDEIVERKIDDSDFRKILVCLTPKGKKIRDKFLNQRRKATRDIFANMSAQDKDAMLNSLDKVCHLLEASMKGSLKSG
jgi:DNA-binding MarR family transcriptional regulator